MGVKSLGYAVVETTQPDRWDHFLTQVAGAMRGAPASDGAALYRVDERPFRFRIENGAADRLAASGYEVEDEAALLALAEKVRASGRPVEMGTPELAASRCVAGLFRTTDPAGNGLEFYHGDQRAETPFVSPVGVPHFVTGIYGMGHSVLAAPDFAASHAFYRDVIGFHDTDLPQFFLMGGDHDPGMRFAFMHADNGRHHSVALAEMPVPPSQSIHLMLELPTLEEVEKAHARMVAGGYKESATLGEHVNDEMTSFYVQTPGGFDLEIGCNGLVIDPATWEVTAHDKVSKWGHVWAWQTEAAQGAA
ncbi:MULTISPECIES: VOC family protein [unclassified Sphingomonas]|uniref:VOC family protein n=1 Tax=unclassified Sphingomonas TaxID=196159 RepID=UPI000927B829|nr:MULTISPECIES: VOC family protein [unclassified Sphingomonas]MBN8848096.1 VOC family protein [Sphingomonas sp.]MBS0283390.1 VOC family protein [Pseudomonadota bacterium]OJV31887.1 MAG: glyoxalase [Sphingomonas sp. 67-36]